MKFINIILLATSVAAAVIDFEKLNPRDIEPLIPRHHRGEGNQNANGSDRGGNVSSGNGAPAGSDSTTGAATGSTLVLKEVNGVPGNECLTFRNNGMLFLMFPETSTLLLDRQSRCS
jgi:hypothetical protein